MSDSVGLREMRQQASELIRRVEGGEELIVTVAGRPAARLVPFRRMRWRNGREIAPIFDTATDPGWALEHAARPDILDERPRDPWDRSR